MRQLNEQFSSFELAQKLHDHLANDIEQFQTDLLPILKNTDEQLTQEEMHILYRMNLLMWLINFHFFCDFLNAQSTLILLPRITLLSKSWIACLASWLVAYSKSAYPFAYPVRLSKLRMQFFISPTSENLSTKSSS